jgi:hypothetical protein
LAQLFPNRAVVKQVRAGYLYCVETLAHNAEVRHAFVSMQPSVGLVEDAYECAKGSGRTYQVVGPCPRCHEPIYGTCEPVQFERNRWTLKRRPKDDVVITTRMWCGCGYQHVWAEGAPADEPGCGNEFTLDVFYPPMGEDGKLRLVT